jgi:mRNA-degrading endonuclease toxin of MazEF toxin-antitoxin module
MQPGQVVTAHLSGGVGAEKDKSRPVAFVYDAGPTALVLAVTDARKKRIPTHALIKGYSSGTQVKDALVTCEHAWFVDPTRLEARPDARSLTADELRSVGQCLRLALALGPGPHRAPPAPPVHRRSALIRVDFAGGIGAEANGVHTAAVLSNDVGNYYGRTLLVAPFVAGDAVAPVETAHGVLDLGRMRVVDVDRVIEPSGDALDAAALAAVAERLEAILP